MEAESQKCAVCSKKFPTSSKGKKYCSEGCRRIAEFEIRRINRRLERLEDRRADEEMDVLAPVHYNDMLGRSPEERLHTIETQIKAEKTRLAALVNSG